ncbi:MAG TPA: hypothetical protein VGL40_09910 [Bacillota bacterium]
MPQRESSYRIRGRKTVEGGVKMTEAEMLRKIRSVEIPPHQLLALGLDRDWSRKIRPGFIGRVLTTAEKYSHVLKELSKR